MSDPALARADEQARRFYQFNGETFWSVTTIISGGVPKYLGPHYAKLAAELAYDAIVERGPSSRATAIVRRLAARGRLDVLARQARGELKSIDLAKLSDREIALRWVKGAADRHRDAAAQKGTDVHAQAEELVLRHAREASRLSLAGADVQPWPVELEGYQRSFTSWIEDWQPEFIAAEATVFNRTQVWAGTLDTVIRLHLPDGTALVPVVDYKSGRSVYAEVALQLSAYARGEFIGASDGVTELPMPQVDQTVGAVLHLRESGRYRFRLVRIDEQVYAAFLFAREVFRFVEELAPTVFLQDLTAAPEETL
jgi:hypothetical protein